MLGTIFPLHFVSSCLKSSPMESPFNPRPSLDIRQWNSTAFPAVDGVRHPCTVQWCPTSCVQSVGWPIICLRSMSKRRTVAGSALTAKIYAIKNNHHHNKNNKKLQPALTTTCTCSIMCITIFVGAQHLPGFLIFLLFQPPLRRSLPPSPPHPPTPHTQ